MLKFTHGTINVKKEEEKKNLSCVSHL